MLLMGSWLDTVKERINEFAHDSTETFWGEIKEKQEVKKK